MLLDDLREQLKHIEPDIQTISQFWQNSSFEQQYQDLKNQNEQEDFWKHPQQADISKELQRIKLIREQYLYVMHQYKESQELLDLFGDDEAELQKFKADIGALGRTIKKFKIQLLLNQPQDINNCFLSVNAGAGGTEAQDWASMVLRMYSRFCQEEHFTYQVIDYQEGEGAGIKGATLFIKGKNAYGLLKSEHGIHRLVRISPFDANKRRHTSFAGVMITPEVPDIEFTIDPNDLRIDTYRASGAGGQHVNKTESAIRITHIPTNTVVQCQTERSQLQNKETAMKMLRAKLAQRYQEERDAKMMGTIEKKKIEWGSQIRSYVLHPYKMVKDHRTDYESPQPELVLDGHLIDFIENYLLWIGKK